MSENQSKLFQSFIKDITNVFPEYEKRLNKYYQTTLDSESIDDPKLKEFLENVNEISSEIINKDISVFDEDPIILQNVSFKLLWNSEGLSDQSKNSIWKYLQTFCAIKIQSESEQDKIDDVIKKIESKEKVKDKETLKNMKKLQKLNEQFNIKEIESVIKDNPGDLDGMGGLDKMFENTSIGQIAKEITEDLDIENILNNGGGIQDLFSGGNMANIMQTISSKMEDKKDTVGSDDLMKEATNICNTMKGNPLFSSLLGMQGGVMESMMQEQGGFMESMMSGQGNTEIPSQPNSEQVRKIEVKDNSHDPNNTKSRLQRKLKEKQMTVDKKE
jgi:hypothetical protein